MQRLQGKVAFIAGGGNWIGKEIAKQFASHGAKVFLIGRELKKLEQVVAEIRADGNEAGCCAADISDVEAVNKAVSSALKKFSKIDILVQSAAIYPMALIEDMSLTEWKAVIDINLTGSFILLKALAETLQQQKNGRVIFISSIAGEEIGYASLAHYAASKAGMNGLMRSAALELGAHQVTVNSIAPGNILNVAAFGVPAEKLQKMIHKIPVGRLGLPADVAAAALFLASDEASFITGQHLVVDGGQTIRA